MVEKDNKDGKENVYGILFGADMAPERIRKAPQTAGARFAGIGKVDAGVVRGFGLPVPVTGEVWGVVLALPATTEIKGKTVPVTLRTGTQAEAVVLTDTASFGDLASALSEAYYWELPGAYRDRLAQFEGST